VEKKSGPLPTVLKTQISQIEKEVEQEVVEEESSSESSSSSSDSSPSESEEEEMIPKAVLRNPVEKIDLENLGRDMQQSKPKKKQV
jgi:hypothetical protein